MPEFAGCLLTPSRHSAPSPCAHPSPARTTLELPRPGTACFEKSYHKTHGEEGSIPLSPPKPLEQMDLLQQPPAHPDATPWLETASILQVSSLPEAAPRQTRCSEVSLAPVSSPPKSVGWAELLYRHLKVLANPVPHIFITEDGIRFAQVCCLKVQSLGRCREKRETGICLVKTDCRL